MRRCAAVAVAAKWGSPRSRSRRASYERRCRPPSVGVPGSGTSHLLALCSVPAEVEITAGEVIVAPGAEEVVEARLRNLGAVTETFSVTVVGAGQGWTVVDPPLVTLFP